MGIELINLGDLRKCAWAVILGVIFLFCFTGCCSRARTYPSDLGTEWVCEEPALTLTYARKDNGGLSDKTVLVWNDQTIEVDLAFGQSGAFAVYPSKKIYDKRTESWFGLHHEDRLLSGRWDFRDGDLVLQIQEDFIFEGAYTELVFECVNEEIP